MTFPIKACLLADCRPSKSWIGSCRLAAFYLVISAAPACAFLAVAPPVAGAALFAVSWFHQLSVAPAEGVQAAAGPADVPVLVACRGADPAHSSDPADVLEVQQAYQRPHAGHCCLD